MPRDLPPPTLVEDSATLADLVAALSGEAEIAVDTEADSFFSYREKVCLIQVSAAGRDWLIDPLAGFDLAPLGPVLADPGRVKIFHDGEFDVLLLKRDLGFRLAGLFDTRVAAAALGDEAPGLAAVLNRRFGVELDKTLQRSDWSRRPLSSKQIDYARLDTHFLIELAHEQREELARLGRQRIVDSECRRIEALEPSPVAFDPDDFARIKGALRLDPLGRRALRELYVMRDRIARERDTSPFRVVNNAVLLRLAQRLPERDGELEAVDGLSPRQARRIGADLLDAIDRARELGPLDRLPPPRRRDGTEGLGEVETELYEALKSWRKSCADREGYDASLVLNRHVMVRLARAAPATPEELERVDGLPDWQREAFGSEILETLAQARRAAAASPRPRRRRRGGRR